MAVFKAFGKGIASAGRKPRILAVLWAFNVLASGLAAAPFLFLLYRDLGHSALGETLRSVDFLWVGDAAYKYQDAAPAVVGGAIAMIGLAVLLSIFLNGGVVGRLVDKDGSAKLGPFFADCGRFFWPYLGLFLMALPFYAVAFGGLVGLFSALVGGWERNAATEWTTLILANLRFLLALVLLTIVQLIFDYARIITAAENDRRPFHALGGSLAFIGKRFFRSWGLFLLIGLVVAGGTVLLIFLSGTLPGTGAFVPAAIALMQLSVVFRLWGKMLFFSAQAEFYRLNPY